MLKFFSSSLIEKSLTPKIFWSSWSFFGGTLDAHSLDWLIVFHEILILKRLKHLTIGEFIFRDSTKKMS